MSEWVIISDLALSAVSAMSALLAMSARQPCQPYQLCHPCHPCQTQLEKWAQLAPVGPVSTVGRWPSGHSRSSGHYWPSFLLFSNFLSHLMTNELVTFLAHCHTVQILPDNAHVLNLVCNVSFSLSIEFPILTFQLSGFCQN